MSYKTNNSYNRILRNDTCLEKKKKKIFSRVECYLCGSKNHRHSDHLFCHICLLNDHNSTKCPYKSRTKKPCKFCMLKSHWSAICPSLWRQYHLINYNQQKKLINIAKSDYSKTLLYQNKIKCCYNCGYIGHPGEICSKQRMTNFVPHNTLFIRYRDCSKPYDIKHIDNLTSCKSNALSKHYKIKSYPSFDIDENDIKSQYFISPEVSNNIPLYYPYFSTNMQQTSEKSFENLSQRQHLNAEKDFLEDTYISTNEYQTSRKSLRNSFKTNLNHRQQIHIDNEDFIEEVNCLPKFRRYFNYNISKAECFESCEPSSNSQINDQRRQSLNQSPDNPFLLLSNKRFKENAPSSVAQQINLKHESVRQISYPLESEQIPGLSLNQHFSQPLTMKNLAVEGFSPTLPQKLTYNSIFFPNSRPIQKSNSSTYKKSILPNTNISSIPVHSHFSHQQSMVTNRNNSSPSSTSTLVELKDFFDNHIFKNIKIDMLKKSSLTWD